jgi:hypothetical protein
MPIDLAEREAYRRRMLRQLWEHELHHKNDPPDEPDPKHWRNVGKIEIAPAKGK